MGRNYLTDFAQGYGFVDNIHRQRRLDEERTQDNEMRREMYGLQMDNTRDQIAQRNADRGVGQARTEAFRMGLEPAGMEGMAGKPEPKYQGFTDNLREMGIEPNSPEGQQAFGKMKPLLDDPERAGKALALAEDIKLYLEQGQMPPGNEVTEYVNLVGEGELQARSQDGLSRKVKRFLPNQQGDGLFVEFDVTKPDGSHYAAPATTGKSADPKDNKVQNYSMEQVLEWFGGSYAALMMVLDAEAKAGVSTTAQAFQQHRQSLQAEQQKRTLKLEDEERGDKRALNRYRGQKEIDQEFAEPKGPDTQTVTLPDGRVKLIDKATGQVIQTYGSASEVPGGPGPGAASSSEVRQAYAEVRQILKEVKNPNKLTPREVSQIQAVLRNVGHEAATEDVTSGMLWWKKLNSEITNFGPMGDEMREPDGSPEGQGDNQQDDDLLGASLARVSQAQQPANRMAEPFHQTPPAAPQPTAPRRPGPSLGLGASEAHAAPSSPAQSGMPVPEGATTTQGGMRDVRGENQQHAALTKAVKAAGENVLLPVANLIEERYRDTPEAVAVSRARNANDMARLKVALVAAGQKFGDVYEALTGVGPAGVAEHRPETKWTN